MQLELKQPFTILSNPQTPMASKKEETKDDTCASTNTIYFYSGVDDASALTLIKELREKETASLDIASKYKVPAPPIELHIRSNGGSVIAAMAVIGTIANLKVPVHSYIDGGAASAGTLISVVCAKRYIYSYSYMLIHQLSSVSWGKFDELKDDMENSKGFMEQILGIYVKHTKIKRKELESILKHDLWWDAKKCLTHGLVDEILK